MRCVRFSSASFDEANVIACLSVRPSQGNEIRVTQPAASQLMPCQRQQSPEVQFKEEGEERARAKDKREVCSVGLHAWMILAVLLSM